MSEKTARTHSHVSNRAKPREIGERKVVFKSVLDNPFRIRWPSVPADVQNSILTSVIALMEGIAGYHANRGKANRKRKREHESGPMQKKRRMDKEIAESSTQVIPGETANDVLPSSPTDGTSVQEPPKILHHLVVGINEVTKRLESQIQQSRVTVVTTAEASEIASPRPHLKFILVCRSDIDPPLLIDHLPHLVAAYNSKSTDDVVKLVPLPKGAESSLAQALGLRRAAVVGIDVACPELATLMAFSDAVPTMVATWLTSVPNHQLVPTHIKQIRTSAPKDMRAAKDRRLEGKAMAKQRQKEAKQPVLDMK